VFIGIFDKLPEPPSNLEFARVYLDFILLIYLFRSLHLKEIVLSPEILVVYVDVFECYLQIILIETLYLLI
jgi:hypothetical protein